MSQKTAGETIFASDYIDESDGSAGKIPFTKDNGKLDPSFMSDSLPWDITASYDENALASYLGAIYKSNINANVGKIPTASGSNINTGEAGVMEYQGGNANAYAFCFGNGGLKMYTVDITDKLIYEYDLSEAYNMATAVISANTVSTSAQDGNYMNSITISDDGLTLYTCGYNKYVFQYDLSTAWDLSTASYSGNSFYANTQLNSVIEDIQFKSDGLTMFLGGRNANKIFEYTLSTAWDLSTASYSSNESISLPSSFTSFKFKADGTKCLVGKSDDLYLYDLTTAWDITTMEDSKQVFTSTPNGSIYDIEFNADETKMFLFDVYFPIYSFTLESAFQISSLSDGGEIDINGQEANVEGVFFKPDGLKMYIVGRSNDTVYGYTLSTAWDLSTASYTGEQLSVSAQETSPYGLFFSDDGTKMYVLGTGSDTVYQYTLSTAWDVTSGSYSGKAKSVSSESTTPIAFAMSDDGTKLYVVQSGGTIYQYTLSTAWDMSTATYDSDSKVITNCYGLSFKSDGLKVMVEISSQKFELWELSTAWDITTATKVSEADHTGFTNATGGIYMHPDGDVVYIADDSLNDIVGIELATAWTLSSPDSDFKSFLISSQEANSRAVFFKSDGTKFYIVGTSSDRVYAYDLSTAWDVTTATYNSENFYVGSQTSSPYSVRFSDDGLIMIVGQSNTSYQYDLSTAWDVSTAVYSSKSYDWTTPSENTGSCYTVDFSKDGKKAYVMGTSLEYIFEYNLGTPWDLEYVTYSKLLNIASIMTSTCKGITWTSDGLNALILDNVTLRQFRASKPFDISSLAYTGITIDISAYDSGNYQPFIKPDGTAIYFVGSTNDKVVEVRFENPLTGYWTKITN